MIPDNALGDRLNDVKDGITPIIPSPIDNFMNSLTTKTKIEVESEVIKKDKLLTIGLSVLTMVDVLIVSILYGYAAAALFSTDWIFLEIAGVGFLANTLFTYTSKLISKLFKSTN